MDVIELIKGEINWVDRWTQRLLADIGPDQWDTIAEFKTSLNWELGHITVAKLHLITSLMPKESAIYMQTAELFDVNQLKQYYFVGTNPLKYVDERPSYSDLLELFAQSCPLVLQLMDVIKTEDLETRIEQQPPVAKTVGQALTFSFKHQMWHNGQISMIKRVINDK